MIFCCFSIDPIVLLYYGFIYMAYMQRNLLRQKWALVAEPRTDYLAILPTVHIQRHIVAANKL